MRKLLFALLLLPVISFAQGTATNIRNGSSLPTACASGDIFYKTTSPIGTRECSVPGNPGTWRMLYGAVTGASGSDGYINFASSGTFASDSRIQFDVATGTFKIGNTTDPGIIELLGTAGGGGNASASSRCRLSYDTTAGALIFKNSSGTTCGPSSGTFPSNTGAVSHQFFTAYNSSTGAFTQAQPAESDLSVTDITTNNASTSAHGFLKKLDNNAAHYMDGTGAWSTPAGGSSVPDWIAQSPDLTPGSPNALDDEFSTSSLSGSWTQTNDTGVTFTVNGSIMTFNAPTNSGDSVRQILKTAPSTPYTITTRMLANVGNQGNFTFTGICVGNSSTAGNVTIFGPGYRQNVGQAELTVVNFTNNTTFSSYSKNFVDWGGTGASYGPYWNRWVYLQFNNDGTNITFKASITGTTGSYYTVYGPVSKTTFLSTIDRVGICVDNNDSSLPAIAMFDYWRVQ